eukprot:8784418-Alexandrium_andersonii.AAC.1
MACNFAAQIQLWYKAWYDTLHHFRAQTLDANALPEPSYEIRNLRGDATNSSALQSHKIYCLELSSLVVAPGPSELQTREYQVSFPKLAFVPDHCTGANLKTLLEQ